MFKLRIILLCILLSIFHCNVVLCNDNKNVINWMSLIPDHVLLSELTIPGTHDSAADCGIAWVKCQNCSILAQLEMGVRAFDIRCRHFKNQFALYHGSVFLNKYFDVDVRDVCIDFLKANPSETILMFVKEEHTAEGNTEHFSQTMRKYIDGFEDYFFLAEKMPTLGEVRGKIVLLRRFDVLETSMGNKINVGNNTTSISITTIKTAIQDHYKVSSLFSVKMKWEFILTHLVQAKNDDSRILYVNFLSGTGICPPKRIAKRVFKRLDDYLMNNPQKNRYGIIFMDYANPQIISRLLK